MDDRCVDTWEKIAEMIGVHEKTLQRRRDELMAAGAIFYRWKGRPPKRVVSCFPSVLKAWIIKKSLKGEDF